VQDGLVECPFCGVIFAKWKEQKTPLPAQPKPQIQSDTLKPCPACRRDLAGTRIMDQRCSYCGTALPDGFDSKPGHTPAAEYKSKTKPASAISILSMIVVAWALLASGGYLWFQKNEQQLKEHTKELMEKATAEGAFFGNEKISYVCMVEAMRRVKSVDNFDLWQQISTQSFLRSCLVAALEPADFCARVPPKSEIMQSVSWSLVTCESAGSPGQPCGRLVRVIQEHCEKKR